MTNEIRRGGNENLQLQTAQNGYTPLHAKTKSVLISMEHVPSPSVMNMFQKNNDASTVQTLTKRHAQLKAQAQRCIDFLVNKNNYKTIKFTFNACFAHTHKSKKKKKKKRSKGKLANVKGKLEKIDTRLRHVKGILESDYGTSDLSECKTELFSVAADLDAFKQMLTALVRQQKEL
ncbi:hypothetical protein RFI_00808 [Reticulomyxa filosa]|uniref:Uncharacterized protein n=1 Tax=Reticulomyxa filosa TaxID=46433 RepID=X6PDW6_RETFI|nr:hypothetical protein RFI_00808 [Reticulomyxa filosa]|eukprot:ETO36254.1 hypothetical protein RFI_00808 [Reticulomyxa filosa]